MWIRSHCPLGPVQKEQSALAWDRSSIKLAVSSAAFRGRLASHLLVKYPAPGFRYRSVTHLIRRGAEQIPMGLRSSRSHLCPHRDTKGSLVPEGSRRIFWVRCDGWGWGWRCRASCLHGSPLSPPSPAVGRNVEMCSVMAGRAERCCLLVLSTRDAKLCSCTSWEFCGICFHLTAFPDGKEQLSFFCTVQFSFTLNGFEFGEGGSGA